MRTVTGAMELLSRVMPDSPLIVTAREASRPMQHAGMRVGTDEHRSVWRSAVIALGLMGVAPTGADVRAAVARENHDQAAVAVRP